MNLTNKKRYTFYMSLVEHFLEIGSTPPLA